MKFIFPKNYNFKSKLFGFIDYSTALIDVVLGTLIFFITNLLFKNINLKIYFFVGLFFPILLFSILGVQKESFLNVLFYIIKFFKNQNVYLYKKDD